MSIISWNESLSVNVQEIDQQHQKLIGMINELYDAMKEGKGNTVLDKVITELIDYTTSHFTTEEKYFEKYSYPRAASHKLEHADFIKKVSSFQEQYRAGQTGLSIEIITFLSNWLKNHIQIVDKQYTPFFNEKGLK